MFLKITVHGLCVVKESGGAGDPHVIIPVDRQHHAFALRIKRRLVTPGPFLTPHGVTAAGIWTCKIPRNTQLSVGSSLKGPRAPKGKSFDPVTLRNLGMVGVKSNWQAGSRGEFRLPRNEKNGIKGFAWIDELKKFKLPCRQDGKDPAQYWPVADFFVWIGEFDSKEVAIDVANGGTNGTLRIIGDEDFGVAELEVACENLGHGGGPLEYWRSFAKVAKKGDKDKCKPEVDPSQAPAYLRHINSPSCPPVKG